MSYFICPVCGSELCREDKRYVCCNKHSYDISAGGYVNLLMSQQSSKKRHGDDKLMVKSRRDFLSQGYYEPLRKMLCECVSEQVKGKAIIADVGCGEGYYTEAISESTDCELVGVDISKDALKYAAKALKQVEFAVASAFSLPLSDNSVDCVVSIFAPSAYNEFNRVLKEQGLLIKAVPLEDHLWELKCAMYDVPYKNKPEKRDEELFELVSERKLKYTFTINSSEGIQQLFRMTPYYYKTGRAEAEKLSRLNELTVTAHFCVEVYRVK